MASRILSLKGSIHKYKMELVDGEEVTRSRFSINFRAEHSGKTYILTSQDKNPKQTSAENNSSSLLQRRNHVLLPCLPALHNLISKGTKASTHIFGLPQHALLRRGQNIRKVGASLCTFQRWKNRRHSSIGRSSTRRLRSS
jgi:hypothetical protein